MNMVQIFIGFKTGPRRSDDCTAIPELKITATAQAKLVVLRPDDRSGIAGSTLRTDTFQFRSAFNFATGDFDGPMSREITCEAIHFRKIGQRFYFRFFKLQALCRWK
jgi:hypothetical protein